MTPFLKILSKPGAQRLVLIGLQAGADKAEQIIWSHGDLRVWKPRWIALTKLREQLEAALAAESKTKRNAKP